MNSKQLRAYVALPALVAAAVGGLATWSQLRYTPLEASSHREAPLIADDPVADNTDLYAFVDPNDATRVTIVANYIPFELPQGGPNYSTFGENVRYEIHVKNNAANTTSDDITYRFTFTRMNQDPTTFFNIRLGQQNLKTTYTCEKIVNGGAPVAIITNGIVPANNVGPRSITSGAGLAKANYETDVRESAITTASTGEKMLCGPADDPFFADLGAIFDLANIRPTKATDGLSHKNCHSITMSIPITVLQKSGKNAPTTILDPDYVIGVWASASRPAMQTLSSTADPANSGDWVQVSRLGMPLTNEVITPIGGKDSWNARTPYTESSVTDGYLSNPELGLYMADNSPMNGAAPKPAGQTYYGEAIPNVAALRIQTKSLYGRAGFPANGFDFRNGADGLYPLKGNPALVGTAFDPATYGNYLLPGPGQPRSADIKPIFHTGVPNAAPYQLATGKGGNPLAAGKPFINNFLPVVGDMLRLNMAVPPTPRNSADFSNQGLLAAAALGLTDGRFNKDASLQNIPNMDGFPNGRRLEDAVDQIELKAVSGVVLAAIGLWYDDFGPTATNPVTPQLGNVLGFTTGVEKNDTTIRATFPFLQTPWSGTSPASGPTNSIVVPNLVVSTAMPVEAGTYNNITITSTGVASFNGPIVVNGALVVQTGGTLSTRGVLATNCQTITGSGTFELQAGATLRICATDGIAATGASGAIQLTGSRSFSNDASYEYIGSDAQTSGTGLPSRVRSLTVNNAAGLTLNNGGVGVAQTVALTSGNLNTSTSQMLTLLSTPTAGTALVVNTAGIVSGPATMQRAIDPAFNPGAGYRHYSSPMVSTTLNDLTSNVAGFTPIYNTAYNTSPTPKAVTPFPNVYAYEQSRVTTSGSAGSIDFDEGFLVPLATDVMTPVRGYDLNIPASSVVDLMGTLNDGPQSIAGLARGTQTQSGWQLLGNPYPSPIDFTEVSGVTAGVTRTNLDDAVYVYQSTGQYVGQYRSYVNGMGGSPQVAAMQGFFMRVTNPSSSGSLALTNAARVTSFATTPSFNRTTADPRPQVRLRLQGSTPLIDETTVYFEQGATAAFDPRFDAFKLPNSSGMSVSSLITNNELSINGLAPLTSAAVTVPLNVQVSGPGSYSLNAIDLLNFNSATPVYLLDTQTGARIDLSKQPVYSFTANSASLPGRFSLLFGASPLATAPAAVADQVKLYPNPAKGSFTVVVPAELGRTPVTATLFNQLGQQVAQQVLPMTAAGASAQFDVSYLSLGVYTLRLKSGDNQVVKRVVVAQ
ncbi:hypothetical protein GCM10023172_36600 [Hymenobacter ginsengisoli]|uniref:Secretion system C-terminal sorting domain-containing protein n=1 Tax=Hymenobacter ginsengisoli TaxID=1051626 RepID=A0ABP8QPC3_9BACT|nr:MULTISPECIES: DUF4331 family protein [unclassified Hymenobacter]MBO2033961.1 DUF4331 family protein [Hymenobacter sp. BT559]